MKLLFMTISLSLLGLSTVFAAKGSGGGVGFKVGGEYITWDESGLELKDGKNREAYELKFDTVKALKKYVKGLPFEETLFLLAYGDKSYFKKVEENRIGKKLRNKIKQEYNQCFKNGNSIRRSKWKIFAVSTDTETFLLPKFFKLSSERKAKILIHEAYVREFGFSCDTLRFDKELSTAKKVYVEDGDKASVDIQFLAKKVFSMSSFKEAKKSIDYYDFGLSFFSAVLNENRKIPIEMLAGAKRLERMYPSKDISSEPGKTQDRWAKRGEDLEKVFEFSILGDKMPIGRMDKLFALEKMEGLGYSDFLSLSYQQMSEIRLLDFSKKSLGDSRRARRSFEALVGNTEVCRDASLGEIIVGVEAPGNFWNINPIITIGKCISDESEKLSYRPDYNVHYMNKSE